MAQSPDHNAGDGEKAESDASKPLDSKATDNKALDKNLPMVVAPKLGAGEDEAIDESLDEPADETATPAAPAAPAHSARFLMLAASVAFAAAFGSFVGAMSGSGLVRFIGPAEPAAGAANTVDAMREMKLDLAALSVIKSDLDTASRNTTSQFAKIADHLDKLDQRTAMASETTGSIASQSGVAPASGTPDVPKLTDRILQDWVVQDVQNGRALVESRYGSVFDVGAGSTLPGVGRVDTIKRQDGQWLVLTERGTITSGR
jgi:hypothetical protein